MRQKRKNPRTADVKYEQRVLESAAVCSQIHSKGDGTGLQRAIELGARLDLSSNEDPISPNLLRCAGLWAARAKGINYSRVFDTLKQNGVDLKSLVEDTFSTQYFLEDGLNQGGSFDLMLEYWPDSFDEWTSIFPIHKISILQDTDKIRAFVKHGGDINAKDSEGQTGLMKVMYAGVAKELIACGANLDAVDNKGYTALWHAMQRLARKIEKGVDARDHIPLRFIEVAHILASNQGLVKDPKGRLLAKQLTKRLDFDNRYVSGFFHESHRSLKGPSLGDQIKELLALDMEFKLSKHLVADSKQNMDESSTKKPKM